eukprot:6180541-Pleurochrysis_carterae.AAC.3
MAAHPLANFVVQACALVQARSRTRPRARRAQSMHARLGAPTSCGKTRTETLRLVSKRSDASHVTALTSMNAKAGDLTRQEAEYYRCWLHRYHDHYLKILVSPALHCAISSTPSRDLPFFSTHDRRLPRSGAAVDGADADCRSASARAAQPQPRVAPREQSGSRAAARAGVCLRCQCASVRHVFAALKLYPCSSFFRLCCCSFALDAASASVEATPPSQRRAGAARRRGRWGRTGVNEMVEGLGECRSGGRRWRDVIVRRDEAG